MDGTLSQADVGHAHFISVLEGALTLLGVSKPSTSTVPNQGTNAKDASSADSASAFADLANRFSSLEVEESLFTNSAPTLKKSKGVEHHYNIEDEQFGEEIFAELFACFCFFDDMQRVRNCLQETWTEYGDGKIDLMAAAVTTNTAFDLVRQASDDFIAEHPRFKPTMSLSQAMYSIACVLRGESPEGKYHPQDPFNIAAADVAEWCFFPTMQLVEAFSRVVEPGQVPKFKPDFFGKIDMSKDRATLSVRERYNQDRFLLLSFLPNFVFLAGYKVEMPAEDEFTRGIREMVKTREVPIWLGFAAQVWLDVYYLLGSKKDQAFQELRICGLRSKKAMDEAVRLDKSIPSRNWPSRDADAQQINVMVDQTVTYDVIGTVMGNQKYDLKGQKITAPKEIEFSFLKAHPILCGLIMFRINLTMQNLGMNLVNAWGSVMHLAYLYNLAQQQLHDAMTLSWPDMDRIIETHGEEYIFFGGKPADLNDGYKKLCLSTGFSAASFATKGRRELKNVASKNGPRLFQSTSVVSSVFLGRYCRNEAIDITVHNVGQLLEDLSSDGKSVNPSTRTGGALMRRKWDVSHTLTPLQLLTALRERLAEEEPKLLFNYFGMQVRSIELLRGIKAELDDKFKQYFGPKYMPDESGLTHIVGFIFNVAIGSAAAARQTGISQSVASAGDGSQVVSRVVQRAATVMRAFTLKKGAVGCKELRVFCKRKDQLLATPERTEKDDKTAYWFAIDEVVDPKVLVAIQTAGMAGAASLLR